MKYKLCVYVRSRRIFELCRAFTAAGTEFSQDFYYFDNYFSFSQFVNSADNVRILDERILENARNVQTFFRLIKPEFDQMRLLSSADPLEEAFAGKSPAAAKIREEIRLAAASTQNVLITGETGCGKSFAASLIHNLSAGKNRPFYKVNIASVSENLIESELFGVREGAYTDARERKGYLSACGNGTLFLDETGELKNELQAKLLDVLERRTFRPVGSDEEKHTSCRFIFATNADLPQKLKDGTFRKDFYYRISDLVIEIPPLRMRREDIPLLCRQFLGDKDAELSENALDYLCSQNWYGNVRELFSCLGRSLMKCRSNLIQAEDIIPDPLLADSSASE